MSVLVMKADGSTEAFEIEKLRSSLRRAGASQEEVQSIIHQIEPQLFDGIKTQDIYTRAFALLREVETPVAARYSIRRALFGLGPTGFPFEEFLARLFESEGYETQVGIILPGRCVEHEIDVAAFNETTSFVAEAKFHARPGIKSDLQVVMYSYARKVDLTGVRICNADHCGVNEYMVITNTKFTDTAQKYAQCMGLNLLSWDYPKDNTLHDRIEKAGIFPITVLQSLNAAQKRALIERGVIICRDLVAKPHLLRHCHISTGKTEAVLSEARQLCAGTQNLV